MSDTNDPREGGPSPRCSDLSEAEKRVKWDAKHLIERYPGSFEQHCNEQDALERQGDEVRRADTAQTPAAPTGDPTLSIVHPLRIVTHKLL